VPFFQNEQQTAVTAFFPFGRVLYEHGGGIDGSSAAFSVVSLPAR